MFTSQYGAIKIRHNVFLIKPYTYDTNVEDIIAENCCDNVTYVYTGPAPCKRGNLGPCPRPWRGATKDRSTTQQLARFRALQDPGDERHGVGRGWVGVHGRRPESGSRQEGRGQRNADERMPTF